MTGVFDIRDSSFRSLIHANASLRRISTGHLWVEGPVWFPAHQCLLFSDIPAQRIHRYMVDGSVNVFRSQSQFANGNTRDSQGRLVTCQHGTRSITRTEHDGAITTLVDGYQGRKLNSPNDLVVKSGGSIWFTDPHYGILSDYEGYVAGPEQTHCGVYCLDSGDPAVAGAAEDRRENAGAGRLRQVCDSFLQPNGLAFSPDETRLYIAESGASRDENVPPVIRVFDVEAGNRLANGREFARLECGIPDGLRVDQSGNIWVSAADGVHCFDSQGTLLGKIRVPETVANLAFGGVLGNELFITASTGVYAIHVNTKAARL